MEAHSPFSLHSVIQLSIHAPVPTDIMHFVTCQCFFVTYTRSIQVADIELLRYVCIEASDIMRQCVQGKPVQTTPFTRQREAES